jgi:anti-sigma B factor antagonist
MSTSAFDVRSSHASDVLIVEAVGEIDMATAPRLAEAIDGTTDTTRRVIVNLADVTFLDSSALNTLVRCRRELGERDIVFRVVVPSERVVRRVFEIAHLANELNLVDSLVQALA